MLGTMLIILSSSMLGTIIICIRNHAYDPIIDSSLYNLVDPWCAFLDSSLASYSSQICFYLLNMCSCNPTIFASHTQQDARFKLHSFIVIELEITSPNQSFEPLQTVLLQVV